MAVGCYGIEFVGYGLGRNSGWRGMVWLLHDLEDSGCRMVCVMRDNSKEKGVGFLV